MMNTLVCDIESSVFEIGKYLIEEKVTGMALGYSDGVSALLSTSGRPMEMTHEWVVAVKDMQVKDIVKGSLFDIHVGGLIGMQAHPLDFSNTSDYTVQFEVVSKRIRQGVDKKVASEKIISDSLCDATRDIVSNYVAPSRLNCKLTAPEKDINNIARVFENCVEASIPLLSAEIAKVLLRGCLDVSSCTLSQKMTSSSTALEVDNEVTITVIPDTQILSTFSQQDSITQQFPRFDDPLDPNFFERLLIFLKESFDNVSAIEFRNLPSTSTRFESLEQNSAIEFRNLPSTSTRLESLEQNSRNETMPNSVGSSI